MQRQRGISACLRGAVPSLSLNGRRVGLLLCLVSAAVFVLHLFVAHVEQTTSPADALAHAAGEQATSPSHLAGDEHRSDVDAEGCHSSAERHGVESDDDDHSHADAACGDLSPSKDALAAIVVYPALHFLWELEPLARTYVPPTRPEVPRQQPNLIDELGVQRV